MFGISMWEIMLVALVLFALVGPGKIPEIAKTVGKALGSFRKSVDDVKKEVNLDEELDFLKDVKNVSVYDVLSDADPDNPSVDMPAGPAKKQPVRSGKKRVQSGRKGLGKVLFGEGRSGAGRKGRREEALTADKGEPSELGEGELDAPAGDVEPVAEPEAEPVAEPEAEPVAEPEAEPVAEPEPVGAPGHVQRGLPLAAGDLRRRGDIEGSDSKDESSGTRRRVKPAEPS